MNEPNPKVDTIAILNQLEQAGFTDAEFRKMHHQGKTIAAFRRYCGQISFFQQGSRNRELHDKLKRRLTEKLPDGGSE